MTDEQTLALYSGHPMGLFPSHKDAPRCVVTNGMVIPNYSSRDDYEVRPSTTNVLIVMLWLLLPCWWSLRCCLMLHIPSPTVETGSTT